MLEKQTKEYNDSVTIASPYYKNISVRPSVNAFSSFIKYLEEHALTLKDTFGNGESKQCAKYLLGIPNNTLVIFVRRFHDVEYCRSKIVYPDIRELLCYSDTSESVTIQTLCPELLDELEKRLVDSVGAGCLDAIKNFEKKRDELLATKIETAKMMFEHRDNYNSEALAVIARYLSVNPMEYFSGDYLRPIVALAQKFGLDTIVGEAIRVLHGSDVNSQSVSSSDLGQYRRTCGSLDARVESIGSHMLDITDELKRLLDENK